VAQQAGSSEQFSSSQYTVHIDRIANIFRYVNIISCHLMVVLLRSKFLTSILGE
jgi:hypothetical protein